MGLLYLLLYSFMSLQKNAMQRNATQRNVTQRDPA